jgi:hypothetical protein
LRGLPDKLVALRGAAFPGQVGLVSLQQS